MNKRRIVFFLVFGLYQVAGYLLTLYLEANKDNLSLLYDMFARISLFKWGTLLGILLWAADVAWWRLERRAIEKEQEASRLENNTLKAKVYDLQQAPQEPTSKANLS
jgi:hypothetical protein